MFFYFKFLSKPLKLFDDKPFNQTFISPFVTVEVDQHLDKESPEYLEALAQATEELEFCVNLCKSRVMMVTCFDISLPTSGAQEGLREMEV